MMSVLRKPSVMALLAANAVPVVGVLAFDWDLRMILFLYWAESAVIGFYNVLKMMCIGGIVALPICVFFSAHYGIFMMVHLGFIFAITTFGKMSPGAMPFEGALEVLGDWGVWTGIAGLFISHGVSFVINFLPESRELNSTAERTAAVGKQMAAPYGRIILMHMTLLIGAFAVTLLGAPAAVLVLLVVFKLIADVAAHAKEHGWARVEVRVG